MPPRRNSVRMGNSFCLGRRRQTASKRAAIIGAPNRAVGQNGVLARVRAVETLRDASVAFPKGAGGEQLRVQDWDARGDPGNVDAGVPQTRPEALEKALRVRSVRPSVISQRMTALLSDLTRTGASPITSRLHRFLERAQRLSTDEPCGRSVRWGPQMPYSERTAS